MIKKNWTVKMTTTNILINGIKIKRWRDEIHSDNMRLDFDEIHLTENEKKYVKIETIRRNRAKTLIRDLIFNSVFLFFLFTVAYVNKDINSFEYKNNLKNVFIDDSFNQVISYYIS